MLSSRMNTARSHKCVCAMHAQTHLTRACMRIMLSFSRLAGRARHYGRGRLPDGIHAPAGHGHAVLACCTAAYHPPNLPGKRRSKTHCHPASQSDACVSTGPGACSGRARARVSLPLPCALLLLLLLLLSGSIHRFLVLPRSCALFGIGCAHYVCKPALASLDRQAALTRHKCTHTHIEPQARPGHDQRLVEWMCTPPTSLALEPAAHIWLGSHLRTVLPPLSISPKRASSVERILPFPLPPRPFEPAEHHKPTVVCCQASCIVIWTLARRQSSVRLPLLKSLAAVGLVSLLVDAHKFCRWSRIWCAPLHPPPVLKRHGQTGPWPPTHRTSTQGPSLPPFADSVCAG